MKIGRFFRCKDVVSVDDAVLIRALNNEEHIDRQFRLHHFLNRFKIRRTLKNLSYKNIRFPHLLPKNDALRIQRHTNLWDLFSAKAAVMRDGVEELEPIAKWIRNEGPQAEPGILAQQVIGHFFNPSFMATDETWQAALVFHEDAVMDSLPKWLWWQLLGKAATAKKELAAAVQQDIVAMHGIGVAVHNLVASLHKLKELYNDSSNKNISPDEAVAITLAAPPVVLRQALANGAVAGCPYAKFTLFLFQLKEANSRGDAKDLVFMSNSWSRCPAEQWIPAVIAGIWTRVQLAGVRQQ